MRTFLVGTDFSELSERALDFACELAQRKNARIHIFHVIEALEGDSDDPETAQFYEELTRKSQAKLDGYKEKYHDQNFTFDVKVGVRFDALLQAADTIKAELIVLGSRPVDEATRRLGTSHRVALASKRPVLLVPESSDE